MAAVVNTGMDKGDMRRILNASKNDPVGCAVGIGDNAALGLLMLHKTRRGKAVEKLLKDEFPDAKSVRFGTAFVDTDDNPKLVQLSLNRAAPGIARKLVKTLKGTGFTKVRIASEDGETEDYQEEDEEAPSATAAAAAPAAASAAAAPPADAAPDTTPQAAALAKLLASLAAGIPRAAGDDDARKAALMKLATGANASLKAGELKEAGTALAALKQALEAPAPASTAASAPAAPPALVQSRQDWIGVRQAVAEDVAKLGSALEATYAGQPFAAEVATRFKAKAEPMLARFDERLGTTLDRLVKATDPAQRETLVTEAKGVVKDYLSFAMTDPFIGELDANPFIALTIRKKATTALAAVAKSIS